jgi:hypothetical protein
MASPNIKNIPSDNPSTEAKSKTILKVEACMEILLDCVDDSVIKPSCTEEGLSKSFEEAILNGTVQCTGEIASAISEEQVKRNIYYGAVEERDNIQSLLCKALDTLDAYQNINNCLSVSVAQESSELPKTIGDLKKWDEAVTKQIQQAAEQIKKTYKKIQEVCKAVDDLRKCYESVCNAQDKSKLNIIENLLKDIEATLKDLVKQAEESVFVIVQVASIHALNNVEGLDPVVIVVKSHAESLKKDTDSNIEGAGKKIAEWQKLYNAALAAVQTAQDDYGKLATQKVAGSKSFCFAKTDLLVKVNNDTETNSPFENLKYNYTEAKKTFSQS